VTAPPENPITEQKRILGKLLFWDEQLSSDNTVACGTCHKPGFGGADPRIARNPHTDNLINTPDDILGSPGTIRSDASNNYLRDSVFGLLPQITVRAANPFINAMFAQDLFWDGRARSTFTNPETGVVSIPIGGALESQAVAPIVSAVEMGHDGRTWAEITGKLAVVTPMILASNLPADIAAATSGGATYPDLFTAAFGDPAITAERIGFALATYERTLTPNQTPWDAFRAGNNAALTPNQVNGLNVFSGSPCAVCHAPPLFTNNSFQNIGLRPIAEDNGRQAVTGNPADRGRFKVPTLRNIRQKRTFMHNGQFNTLNAVIGFYANGAAQFPDNRSPLLPVALPPQAVPNVIDFLANGLADPRVVNEQFPFDRPQLHSDSPFPNPSLVGGGIAGSGGIVPAMIAISPPNLGNIDFKVGVNSGLGGAEAVLAMSASPPVGGNLVNPTLSTPITLDGAGNGQGYGTWQAPIDQAMVNSCDVYVQWQIRDPEAADGLALSPVAHLRMIPYLCGGDMNCDGQTNGLDIQAFVQAVLDPAGYAADHPNCNRARGDMNADNLVNLQDVAPFADKALGL
jgi:cytochrome c peroxidase